jgi:hypothetical protein
VAGVSRRQNEHLASVRVDAHPEARDRQVPHLDIPLAPTPGDAVPLVCDQ